jgi:hypothetical protein
MPMIGVAIATSLIAACEPIDPCTPDPVDRSLDAACTGTLSVDFGGAAPVFAVEPGVLTPTAIMVNHVDVCEPALLTQHQTWEATGLGEVLVQGGLPYGVAPAGSQVWSGPLDLVVGDTYTVFVGTAGAGGRFKNEAGAVAWDGYFVHGTSGSFMLDGDPCP